MKPTLAAGVTMDFIHAAPKSAKLSTVMVSPLFFLCSLLTTVPRSRESASGFDDRGMRRRQRMPVGEQPRLNRSLRVWS